ncbi:PREDICTED: acetylcholinesterase-like [Branchiostoma belcheri]|uniref:Carboxylic ester hydrolase n=1 Tax=Branchiostoma belcheri TaxID=7741 RepID=A0A6P4XNV5_BRABE|nr:PREDICTED: acetylcholinesterase-like [Branchiostoma belcheri]
MASSVYLASLLALMCLILPSRGEEITVTTQSGDLRGMRVAADSGTTLDIFLGVPFAKPPTGDRRFLPPEPVEPWTDVRNATAYGPACPQYADYVLSIVPEEANNTSEDCLYLDIYTPQANNSAAPLPVMIWIHGGAYRFGSGKEYEGVFLASRGVVLVSINYRIGALGWLSTGDEHAPGNNGLLDQIEAMRWVRTNIRAFGGDPDLVTIFGQSAGGSSVSLHMFLPRSEGLFHRVIAMSGVALSPFAVLLPPYRVADYAEDLASKLGCPTHSSSSMVACLREKPAELFYTTYVRGPPMISVWAPHLDGPGGVIPEAPARLLREGRFYRVPLMAGTVPREDFYDAPNGIGREEFMARLRAHCQRYHGNADAMFNALLQEYTDWTRPEQRDVIWDLDLERQANYGYHSPTDALVAGHSATGAGTYLYYFTHRSDNDPHPVRFGAIHTVDLPFLFGPRGIEPYRPPVYTDVDNIVRDNMLTLWTNFARDGNPTPSAVAGVTWEQYQTTSRPYLEINSSLVPKNFLFARRNAFWNEYVPTLLNASKCEEPPASRASILLLFGGTTFFEAALCLVVLFLCDILR